MKALLLSLIAPLTGCIITTAPSDVEEVGFIDAAWSFQKADGTKLGCPDGFGTVEVSAYPLSGGPGYIDLYDCDVQRASAPYPLDEYEVTIAITNRAGTSAYAQSLSYVVDLFPADATVSEDFIHDGGRILFDWALVDAKTNAPLDCRAAGSPAAIRVEAATPEASIATELPCGDGFGVSSPLLAGAYQATFTAIDKAGKPLGAPQTKPVAVRDRNDYDDVGTVTLPIGNLPPAPQ